MFGDVWLDIIVTIQENRGSSDTIIPLLSGADHNLRLTC